MAFRKFIIDVPVAAGSADQYSPEFTGFIESIHYIKDGSVGYANGVDFDLSLESTGEKFWDQDNVDASVVKRPRMPIHDGVGVAALYASTGTAINDKVCVVKDRVRIQIANGGTAKTGRFIIITS